MEPTRHEFIFQGPEAKGVFYVLTLMSLAAMVWQVWRMRQSWLKGKPTPWRGAGCDGIRSFVFGQRKVKESRPKGGAPMHLFMFYGFLGLFLATSLLGLATYSPLIGLPNWHTGTYYLIYEFLADTAGLVFLVGVAWAFWRRLVMWVRLGRTQPGADGKLNRSRNPLTTEWKDWAVLVLLGALAKAGFLVEAMRISTGGQTGLTYHLDQPIRHIDLSQGVQASYVGYWLAEVLPPIPSALYVLTWWLHAALVWAFFIFLPQMRIKHIVVAFFSAAGKPDWPMGQLQPVDMDE
ncbi:MAG: hypothetical protein ABUL72_06020, partial [Armatimonadota bacterium]